MGFRRYDSDSNFKNVGVADSLPVTSLESQGPPWSLLVEAPVKDIASVSVPCRVSLGYFDWAGMVAQSKTRAAQGITLLHPYSLRSPDCKI
jgi:hypothetical protein